MTAQLKIPAVATMSPQEMLRMLAEHWPQAANATDVEKPTLEWSPTLLKGKRVDYEAALKAVAELGPEWRLPTFDELFPLVDRTRHDPAIDVARFPDTKSEPYWTSTPCAWNASAVWVVYFGGGHANGYYRDDDACVRAVRVSSAGQ